MGRFVARLQIKDAGLAIFSISLPIFLTIGLGFILVRNHIVPKAAIDGMGAYVLYCALPVLLFQSISSRSISEIFNVRYFLIFALGSVITLLLSFAIAYYLRRRSLAAAAFQGLGASLSNNAFIGYALMVQLFGSIGAVASALSVLVDLLVLLPITLVIAESARGDARNIRSALWVSLKNTVKNPLVVAIFLGLLASMLQWQAEGVAKRFLEPIAASAPSLSLFVIGGVLVGRSIHGQISDLTQMVVFKLLIHPSIMMLVILAAPPLDPAFRTAAILLASMSMAGVFPLIAQKYGQEGVCSTALVGATSALFITINLILWILNKLGWLETALPF